MKMSKQKFFDKASVLVRTDRSTGLTIGVKLCGSHIKVATTLLGKDEKFSHKKGIGQVVTNITNNKFIVLPIDHNGTGLTQKQRLIALMNDMYRDISWGL